MGVFKHRGTPKWMVYNYGKPYVLMDNLGSSNPPFKDFHPSWNEFSYLPVPENQTAGSPVVDLTLPLGNPWSIDHRKNLPNIVWSADNFRGIMPFKPFIYVNLPVPTFWGAFFSTKISNHANAPPATKPPKSPKQNRKNLPSKNPICHGFHSSSTHSLDTSICCTRCGAVFKRTVMGSVPRFRWGFGKLPPPKLTMKIYRENVLL